MSSKSLELNCMVFGDDSQRIIVVDIAKSKTVSALKDLIKAKKQHAFADLDADELTLCKVSIAIDKTLKAALGAISFDSGSSDGPEELSPVDELSEVFLNAPVRKHIHILILTPDGFHPRKKLRLGNQPVAKVNQVITDNNKSGQQRPQKGTSLLASDISCSESQMSDYSSGKTKTTKDVPEHVRRAATEKTRASDKDNRSPGKSGKTKTTGPKTTGPKTTGPKTTGPKDVPASGSKADMSKIKTAEPKGVPENARKADVSCSRCLSFPVPFTCYVASGATRCVKCTVDRQACSFVQSRDPPSTKRKRVEDSEFQASGSRTPARRERSLREPTGLKSVVGGPYRSRTALQENEVVQVTRPVVSNRSQLHPDKQPAVRVKLEDTTGLFVPRLPLVRGLEVDASSEESSDDDELSYN